LVSPRRRFATNLARRLRPGTRVAFRFRRGVRQARTMAMSLSSASRRFWIWLRRPSETATTSPSPVTWAG